MIPCRQNFCGSSHGMICRLEPHVRMIFALILAICCILVPACSVKGVSAILLSVGLWIILCRPLMKFLKLWIATGVLLYLPYFLLLPLIDTGDPMSADGAITAISVPSLIFLRGMSCLLLSLSTVSTLRPDELREGIIVLPLPRLAVIILVQIMHQADNLMSETMQIASAITVRGAVSGFGALWRLACALPTVWLPRIMDRSERVAIAMEIRGYENNPIPVFRKRFLRRIDIAALLIAFMLLGLSLLARIYGI